MTTSSSAAAAAAAQLERSDPIRAMESCANVAAISGAVDIGLYVIHNCASISAAGSSSSSSIQHLLTNRQFVLDSLFTLWKWSFCYHLKRAAKMDKEITFGGGGSGGHNGNSSSRIIFQGVAQLLRTMKWVWRQSAALAALATVTKIALAWEDKLPHIQRFVGGTVAVAIGTTMALSTTETKQLGVASNDKNMEDVTSNTLRQETRQTTRAMATCSNIMILRAISIPATKLGMMGGHYKTALDYAKPLLISIPDFITPLGIGMALRTLRQKLLLFMAELLNSRNNLDQFQKRTITGSELTMARLDFFQQVQSALRSEMIFKVIAAIVTFAKAR